MPKYIQVTYYCYIVVYYSLRIIIILLYINQYRNNVNSPLGICTIKVYISED